MGCRAESTDLPAAMRLSRERNPNNKSCSFAKSLLRPHLAARHRQTSDPLSRREEMAHGLTYLLTFGASYTMGLRRDGVATQGGI
jgi:hypothetical protein